MRTALLQTLLELAEADQRIFLLTGDLGWSVVEPFAARHPGRFVNVGVAEANMAGIAAGLAMTGFVPFVYSIATFASMRCYEQVRNGALLHNLPVRIVGIGGGYAYGHAGPTHYALEDVAIHRIQPGMTVVVPADPAQTRNVVRATLDVAGPVYLRVGKGGNPELPGLDGRFAFGRPELLRDGRDLLFIASGPIALEALRAAEGLAAEGVSAAMAVMAHLPLVATEGLVGLLKRFPAVVSVEEGFASGGLGSLVAETVASRAPGCRLRVCGVIGSLGPESGSETFMRHAAGLDAAGLLEAARVVLRP